MFRTALRVLVRVALLAGVAASFGTGCSRQAEGERCDYTWAGDQDCDEGLVCTPCGRLQQKFVGGDRCCLPSGAYTDTRCIPTTNPTEDVCNTHIANGNGSAGTTGTAGSGTAGSGTAGSGTAGSGTAGTGGTSGTEGTTGEGGNGATSGIGGAADGG